MSERVAGLFEKYAELLRVEAEGEVAFLKRRLEDTYGHVEHEIIGDQVEAAIREKAEAK